MFHACNAAEIASKRMAYRLQSSTSTSVARSDAPRREHLMADLTDRFGTMVFSEDVMKKWLPKDVYKKLAATIEEGQPLDLDVANAVAHAMKEWAIAHSFMAWATAFATSKSRGWPSSMVAASFLYTSLGSHFFMTSSEKTIVPKRSVRSAIRCSLRGASLRATLVLVDDCSLYAIRFDAISAALQA